MLVIERHFGSEVRLYEDVVPTLKKNMGDGGGNVPMVIEPIVFRDDITIKIDGGASGSPLEAEILRECNA